MEFKKIIIFATVTCINFYASATCFKFITYYNSLHGVITETDGNITKILQPTLRGNKRPIYTILFPQFELELPAFPNTYKYIHDAGKVVWAIYVTLEGDAEKITAHEKILLPYITNTIKATYDEAKENFNKRLETAKGRDDTEQVEILQQKTEAINKITQELITKAARLIVKDFAAEACDEKE